MVLIYVSRPLRWSDDRQTNLSQLCVWKKMRAEGNLRSAKWGVHLLAFLLWFWHSYNKTAVKCYRTSFRGVFVIIVETMSAGKLLFSLDVVRSLFIESAFVIIVVTSTTKKWTCYNKTYKKPVKKLLSTRAPQRNDETAAAPSNANIKFPPPPFPLVTLPTNQLVLHRNTLHCNGGERRNINNDFCLSLN